MSKMFMRNTYAIISLLLTTVISAPAIAQNPGGVAGSVIWLKADAGSFSNAGITASTDGGTIQQWNDQSGNNNHATQTTAAAKPIWQSSAATGLINFNPRVNLDGTAQYFNLPSGFNDFTAGISFFSLSNFTNTGVYARLLDLGNGQANNNIVVCRQATFPNVDISTYNGFTPANGVSTTAMINLNKPCLYQALVPGGAVSSSVTSVFKTDALAAALTPDVFVPDVITRTSNFIGKSNWSLDALFKGQMGEFILYNRTLSATEEQKVQSYIALKYGTSLDQATARDYIASDGITKMWNATTAGSYNKNIFGIGRDDNSALNQKVSASVNTRGIVTISTTNDFVSANNNAARTSLSNLQFLTVSDNAPASGNPTWTATGSSTAYNILSSQWKVQNTGSIGYVYLQFNVANTNYDVPNIISGSTYYLAIDPNGDGNYASDGIMVPLTNTSGSLWSTSYMLASGMNFTLATSTAAPGGVGSAALWVKADGGVTGTAPITAWTDQTATNTFTVTGSGTFPTLGTNLINFNPGVQFDGNSRFTGNTSITNCTEAFAVAKIVNGTGTGGSGAVLGNTIAFGGDYFFHTEGGLYYTGNPGVYASTNLFGNNVPYCISNADLSETPAANQKIKINGADQTNNTGQDPVPFTRIPVIGARATQNLPSGSEIAEVILYISSQAGANRQKIQSYLALKYGITLDQTTATDYIASDGATKMWNAGTAGTYKYNVFGIGRDNGSALYQKVSTSVNGSGIVTVATENDFSSANNNGSRNDVLTDKQFLTISNNSVASPAWGSSGAVITGKQILNNSWAVQNMNGVGGVYLQFNDANANWDLPLSIGSSLYLVYDNAGTIGAGSTVVALVQSGSLWTTSSAITFSNLAKFTLAMALLNPGSIGTNQSVCQGLVPANPLTETTAATSSCAIAGYQWQSSIDNGVTWTNIAGATSTNYTFTAPISVQTLYRRAVTNACAATAYSDTITVAIYGTVTAGVIGADQTICSGAAAASLTNTTAPTGGDGTYAYQWQSSSDNITWSDIIGASIATYAPGVLTTSTYFRRNVTSCSGASSASSAAVLIIVNDPAVITTQPVSKGACVGATTGFDLFASGSGLTYQWQQRPGSGAYTDITDVGVFSGTTTSTLKLTGVTSGMNNYSYRCVITSPCTATLTSNVVLLSVLVAINNNISSDQSICTGSTAAVLTGTTSSAYTYLWESSTVSASSGFVPASGTNSAYDYNPNPVSTLTWYRRLVKNVACSTYSSVVSIAVNPQPTVIINSPAAVCAPATINITASAVTSGSTTGLTYTYFTDAAATTALLNPGAVTTSGTYYIKGTTASGCYDIKPVIVTINSLPTATISYGGSSYCPTGTATVTRTGQAGGTYSSTAGLSINASTGTIDLVTSVAGIYTVTYSFSNGTCGNTTTATITIDGQPSVVITNPAAVCSPATVNITTAAITAGSSSGLIYTYFTDVAATTTLSNPNAVTTGGTYYIKGATASGCYDIKPVTVTINALPTATIQYSGSPYCATGIATVTQTGQTGGTYSSTTGLSINTATGAINLTTSTAGTYTVTYSFSNGSCSNTTTVNVTIDTPPSVVITSPAAACAPGTVDITSALITTGSDNGLTYTYYTDAAGINPLSNPNAVGVTGTYYIKGTSAAGCFSLPQPVNVVINPQPSISLSADKTLVCKWDAVSLSASAPGSTVVWQQVGTGNNVTVYPSQNTSYTATATDALGCANTDHINISVRDFKAALTAMPNPVMSGTMVTLTPSANSSFTALAWTPAVFFQNQQAAAQTMQITDSSKTFAVVLQSADGCRDTASVFVTVNDNTKELFIPNAFTPNNDGKNDVFKVYGTSVKGVNIQVFNQWGNLMIETTDNNRGWDGVYKGKQQPVGVYLYVIKIQLYNNGTVIRNGTVNLIR